MNNLLNSRFELINLFIKIKASCTIFFRKKVKMFLIKVS